MIVKIGVVVAIKNTENKFLVIKRAPHDTFSGIWEFPCGGLEIEDENLVSAAIREVKEETSLKITNVKSLGFNDRIDNKKSKRVIMLHFYSNNFEGEVKLTKDHSDFKWLSKEEILSMKPSKDIGIDSYLLLKSLKTLTE